MKKAPTYKRMQKRPEYKRRIPKVNWYNAARWNRLRKRQLQIEPLCRACKENGYIEAATTVDHIKSHKGCHILFFDPKNLQSLCMPCHNSKTAKEDGGFGR